MFSRLAQVSMQPKQNLCLQPLIVAISEASGSVMQMQHCSVCFAGEEEGDSIAFLFKDGFLVTLLSTWLLLLLAAICCSCSTLRLVARVRCLGVVLGRDKAGVFTLDVDVGDISTCGCTEANTGASRSSNGAVREEGCGDDGSGDTPPPTPLSAVFVRVQERGDGDGTDAVAMASPRANNGEEEEEVVSSPLEESAGAAAAAATTTAACAAATSLSLSCAARRARSPIRRARCKRVNGLPSGEVLLFCCCCRCCCC